MKTTPFLVLLLSGSTAPLVAAFSLFHPTSSVVLSTTATAHAEVDKERSNKLGNQESTTTTDGNKSNEGEMSPPGMRENDVFECDESVTFWRDFQRQRFLEPRENLEEIARVTQRFTTKYGTEGLDHWWRHVARTSYFATNGVLGATANAIHDRFVAQLTDGNGFVSGLRNSATRLILEAALVCEEDFLSIQKGLYKKPYDMYEASQQASPLYFVPQTARFVREAVGTLTRRNRQDPKDKQIWLSASHDLFPEYYQTAFHFQTDGWMSSESAAVYEVSTETLFVGRQDAMQRTALPPLLRHSHSITGRPMRVLEVACGTGRFMTFCRDNLPADTEYTAIDLSPFYLEKARDNDNRWRRLRRDTEGNIPSPAKLIQAKAENLPFSAEEFDAVVCVYLFHELPREVRTQVVKEMARVVKPGGVVILTDSLQQGDRPSLDKNIVNFEKLNEPYYVDYVQDYLPDHFISAGLQPSFKTVRSVTKTLTFQKV
jgi:ubiquinone/menaquinone biosynthesis C-methylase UbiE